MASPAPAPAPAGTSDTPSTQQAACLVKPAESCWFWRGVEKSSNALRDPSALPPNKRQHELRLQRNLWGPRWAQLCPGRLKTIKGKWAVVEEFESKKVEQVPASMLLPLYEGLLVLDAVSKLEPKVAWLSDHLTRILESERAKYRYLSAYLYSTKQLTNIAVTGPLFYGSAGPAINHRRQLSGAGPPEEAQAQEGWYSVQGIVEYLPPWEAFLHPKCGIYQDFYMVLWGPPHNATNFSTAEHGADTAGATWEPDECLPEDLDSLRAQAKRRWADQQKEKEALEREQLEKAKREREVKAREQREDGDAEEVERPKKRLFNPMRLDLISDIANPRINHGSHNVLRSTDDQEIKRGWPKSIDEYPGGYGPADPPGCCGLQCDCMEDWHLGRKSLDAGRPWVDTPSRNESCQKAVEMFISKKDIVNRRGTVSNMHFLEAISDRHKRSDIAQVAFAAAFAKLVTGVLREAAQRIPVDDLAADIRGSSPGMLVRMLSAGFASDKVHIDAGGPFVPLQYQGEALAGFHVDAGTGAVRQTAEAPDTADGEPMLPLKFTLKGMVPGESSQMDCGLDLRSSDAVEGFLSELTNQVVAKLPRLEPAALNRLVQERLEPVYNFEIGSPVEAGYGAWVHAMWSVAIAVRASSVGQLFPPAFNEQ